VRVDFSARSESSITIGIRSYLPRRSAEHWPDSFFCFFNGGHFDLIAEPAIATILLLKLVVFFRENIPRAGRGNFLPAAVEHLPGRAMVFFTLFPLVVSLTSLFWLPRPSFALRGNRLASRARSFRGYFIGFVNHPGRLPRAMSRGPSDSLMLPLPAAGSCRSLTRFPSTVAYEPSVLASVFSFHMVSRMFLGDGGWEPLSMTVTPP